MRQYLAMDHKPSYEHPVLHPKAEQFPAFESPFRRAPEQARTIFLVTLIAACVPLAVGLLMFGWRAGVVTAIAVASCAIVERLYFIVTRTPALLGRSHAYLTGLLLALTLPAYVPWYVPVVAGAFAIIVGKGVFGGIGHFLWQPALVGRLAVAVMFPMTLTAPVASYPTTGPVLARTQLLFGDINNTRHVGEVRNWRRTSAPQGADAMLVNKPMETLRGLTLTKVPQFSALGYVPEDVRHAKPSVLSKLPAMKDMILGARPGGIGETGVLVILIAGMYLVYRNYVKLHLPLAFILTAGLVAAVAPIKLAGVEDSIVTIWWPVLARTGYDAELIHHDVGQVYVVYQLLSGELLLAAFFLATEMTSRPVGPGSQVIFGIGCGALAMLLQLYVNTPIPAYMAVLAMNTFTPVIDAIWRPRVLGQPRMAWLPWKKKLPGKTGTGSSES